MAYLTVLSFTNQLVIITLIKPFAVAYYKIKGYYKAF